MKSGMMAGHMVPFFPLFIHAPASLGTPAPQALAPIAYAAEPLPPAKTPSTPAAEQPNAVPNARASRVPFYSQFRDISSPKWQKVGCGIASLAMVIEYYNPRSLASVDSLLSQGIRAGAYTDAGWSHAGLIGISKKYGLTGATRDLSGLSSRNALGELEKALASGPVIASVHYTFAPTNPIPHLVVITAVRDGMVYYNDPAEKSGNGEITAAKFLGGWKKRYIALRPDTAHVSVR